MMAPINFDLFFSNGIPKIIFKKNFLFIRFFVKVLLLTVFYDIKRKKNIQYFIWPGSKLLQKIKHRHSFTLFRFVPKTNYDCFFLHGHHPYNDDKLIDMY